MQLHLPGVGVLEFQRGEHIGVGVPDGFLAQMLGHAVLGFDGQLLQIHETFLALALAQCGHGHVGDAHHPAPVAYGQTAAPVVFVARDLIFAAVLVLRHVGLEIFVGKAAAAALGIDAVHGLRPPGDQPERGAAAVAATGVQHVFGIAGRVTHGQAVEFVGVAVAVAIEQGAGHLLAHGLGKGDALAHAEGAVTVAVQADLFHIQFHDGLKDAATFLDLAPLGLGGRRALIEAAPVHGGQAGADARQVAVGLVGFHPGHVIHDVVGLVHQLDDLAGLVAAIELFHFGQRGHKTQSGGHEVSLAKVVGKGPSAARYETTERGKCRVPVGDLHGQDRCELQPAYMRSSRGGRLPPPSLPGRLSSSRLSARRLKKRSTAGWLP